MNHSRLKFQPRSLGRISIFLAALLAIGLFLTPVRTRLVFGDSSLTASISDAGTINGDRETGHGNPIEPVVTNAIPNLPPELSQSKWLGLLRQPNDTAAATYQPSNVVQSLIFSATEVIKLTAPDAAAGDWFGDAVAISGDTLIIGASSDDTDIGAGAGSVYIFERNQGGADQWGLVKKLAPSDEHAGDRFGNAVAINGNTLVVGAFQNDDAGTGSGSAYVFERNQGGADQWGEVAKITASDAAAADQFGISVTISGDTLVVGAHQDSDTGQFSGSAYVFERDQGGINQWGEFTKITATTSITGDRFGTAVALSGDTLFVGAPFIDESGNNFGLVYIFERNQGGADQWGYVTEFNAADTGSGDRFGEAISISDDTVVVGAIGTSTPGIGSAGAAYVFMRNQGGTNQWGQVQRLIASDAAQSDWFGDAVAISGDTVIVGAHQDDDFGTRTGSAYIFERNQGGANQWGEVQKLLASDAETLNRFGYAVAVDGSTTVIGAYQDSDDGQYSGSAYVFDFGFIAPPAPEITVIGNGQEVANGNVTPSTTTDTDFGSANINSETVVHTFTIENSGNSALTLTGTPDKVTLSGVNAEDFTVTGQPDSPINGGGTTTFEITFDPSVTGARTATVTIPNDDSDEAPYSFAIQGEGIDPVGSLTIVKSATPADGADFTFTSTIPGGDNYAQVDSFSAGLPGSIGTDIAVDDEGYIYVLIGSLDEAVRQFDSSGNPTGFTFDSVLPTTPAGLSLDSAGNFYMVDANGNVQQYDSTGTPTGLSFNSGMSGTETGIAVDSAGNIYILTSTGNIQQFDNSGNPTGFAFTTGAGFEYGISMDSAGNFYIVIQDGTVQQYDSSGNPTNLSVSANVGGTSEVGVAIDDAGNIYVINAGGTIGKYSPTQRFTLDDEPAQTDDIDDTIVFTGLRIGDYTITEVLPADWELSGVTCTGGSGSYFDLNGADLTVTIDADETITCTFENINPSATEGTVTLVKSVINDDGGTAGVNAFGLSLNDNPVNSGEPVSFAAGSVVTITEVGLPGYEFVSITGDGCPAALGDTVTVNGSENVVCTITNDDIAPTITVNKVLAPPSDTGAFSLTIDSVTYATGGHGTTTGAVEVDAGTHTIGELGASGTDLAGYETIIGGDCATDGTVTVDLAEAATCTITNTLKTGSLTIVTEATPADGTPFAFTSNIPGGATFTLDDEPLQSDDIDDTMVFTGVPVGDYTITETVPADWQLADVTCDNNAAFTATASGVTVTLTGEDTICTFTNQKQATLTIVNRAFTGDTGQPTFDFSGTTPIGNFGLNLGDSQSFDLFPGSYTLAEAAPTGWNLDGVSCDNGVAFTETASGVTVTMAGQNTTCTFTNDQFQPNSITIIKKAAPADGTDFGFSFGSPGDGIISTIAGNGGYGYSGDGGPATSASFYNPRGVAVDSAGNIYIADINNYRIRKVDTNGIITTIAGNGSYGFSGDGGPATSARLGNIQGVAVDSTGNLYITDYYSYSYSSYSSYYSRRYSRIRKVDTNGIITTIAGQLSSGFSGDGGPATNARLYYPTGVAVDSAGNVYIADHYNHRIRKVNANGIISTIAGNRSYGYDPSDDGGPATNASLYYPYGVAVDSAGNVYIADHNNRRIRKVDTNGIISTIAGNGSYGYDPTDDGGLATDASLYYPYSVAVDSASNVYIADYYNRRIRKVGTNGIITTIAGNGEYGYDPSDDGGPATEASFYYPYGVAVDNAGNVYIADAFNRRIRKVTTPPTTFKLDDESTQTDNIESSLTFSDLAADDYLISEQLPDDWALENVVCTGGSGNFFSLTDETLSVSIDTDEDITCIFSNQKPATLTIAKTSLISDSTSFDFSGSASVGNFSLGIGDSQEFTLPAGDYTITEIVSAGWALESVSCDNNANFSETSSGVTVTMAGVDTTCIFTNRLETSPLTLRAYDSDNDGQVDPGESILYTMNIQNGDGPAANVQFSSTLDTNSTLQQIERGDNSLGDFLSSPIARNDGGYQTGVDSSLTVPDGTGDLLANDNDPDGGAVSVVPASGASANGGTFQVLANGGFSYTPPSGYQGSDTFIYQVVDDEGDKDPATVTIVVGGVAYSPTAPMEKIAVAGLSTGQRYAGLARPLNVPAFTVALGSLDANQRVKITFQAEINSVQTPSTNDEVCTQTTLSGSGPLMNLGTDTTCTPLAKGIINLVAVDTGSDNPLNVDFNFSSSLPNNADITLKAAQTKKIETTPGSYTITGVTPAGWSLDNITCQPATGSEASQFSTSLPTAQANIELASGEEMTCTFESRRQTGVITITLVSDPPDGTDFEFEATAALDDGSPIPGFISHFILDDEAEESGDIAFNVAEFSDIPVGEYNITELVPSDWQITGIDCQGDANVTSINNGEGVRILLGDGEATSCTVSNYRDSGSLTITKIASPNNGTDFDFTLAGSSLTGDIPFTLDDEPSQTDSISQSITFAGLTVGDYYTVTETVPDNWVLSLAPNACTGDDGNPVAFSPVTDGLRISPEAGDDITCVFTNTGQSMLTVTKIITNDNGGTAVVSDFPLFIDGAPIASGQAILVSAGVHTVSETNQTGYVQSFGGGCDQNGQVSVGVGDRQECIIYNDDIAPTITVNKVVVPATDTGVFSLTIDSVIYGAGGDGATTGAVEVVAGLHTIGELGANETDLAHYNVEIGGDCAVDGAVSVGPAEAAACTITNTLKTGSLTIVKAAVPADGTDFDFTSNIPGAGSQSFTLDDEPVQTDDVDHSITFSDLPIGQYTVSEVLSTDWLLDNVACTGGTGDYFSVSNTNLAVIINDEETVICTFSNEKESLPSHLSINKTVQLLNDPVQPGDPITYTVVVENSGGDATGVVVTDTLPAYLIGDDLATTVDIASNERVTFTLEAIVADDVPAGLTITNTARFSHTASTGQAQAAFTVAEASSLPTVCLYQSDGITGIAGGVVQYYAGGWQVFGATGADGCVEQAIPLQSYRFQMNYGGTATYITQN
ncbi:MAG: choice-of-anchor D domain-containing protein, partial [Anaerolineae bacterium]|nr:choice-of-anchor D domain-containing protein [Anaerolineae bacterium]